MAFDAQLADRIRDCLADRGDVREIKMFGGLCVMVGGHMTCGAFGDSLMLRLDDADAGVALAEPHTRQMARTGLVLVDPPGIETDAQLRDWIERALAFTTTLPPKA